MLTNQDKGPRGKIPRVIGASVENVEQPLPVNRVAGKGIRKGEISQVPLRDISGEHPVVPDGSEALRGAGNTRISLKHILGHLAVLDGGGVVKWTGLG